jgi:D-aminoacyl-tRNA deacylase
VKALLQRVSQASVSVDGEVAGAIDRGLVVLVCAEPGDGEAEAERLARKIAALRIFEDGTGRMNLSVRDVAGSALVVSQFTLAADLRRGNRPSFTGAAPPAEAEALYERFCALLATEGVPVATGRFAARMQVALVNDGPVTIWLDSAGL